MPKLTTLQDVYLDALRDLYNAETQITKALPRVMKSVAHDELKSALEIHLEETEGHIERLERVFEMADSKVRGKKCAAMEGIIEEAKELISMDIDENAFDAAMIGALQKVEHYEIASYGTVRTWAQQLGFDDQADLLEETLNEEKAANDKLTQIAESIVNAEAQQGEPAYAMSHNGFSPRGKRR